MKGKIIATAIIAIFLASMIPVANADTAPTSYKASYPAEWIDSDIQETTAGATLVGGAKLGFANTMTASDDEDPVTGEDYQIGIKGDLTPEEPGWTYPFDGSYIYYNGNQYRFHGITLGTENVQYYGGESQEYCGWIWRQNPTMSNGYEEYRFKAKPTLNIDQAQWWENVYRDKISVGRNYYSVLYAEFEFNISTTEDNIPSGYDWYDIGPWNTYYFYATGDTHQEYTSFPQIPVVSPPTLPDIPGLPPGPPGFLPGLLPGQILQPIVFYSSTDNTVFVSELYNFTWIQPKTKENFDPNFNAGRTLPVKFTITTPDTTDFVHDETIEVNIYDSAGVNVFSAAYGKGSTSVRIDDTDNQYIVNWHTEKTYTGDYCVVASFSNGFVTAGVVTL